MVLEDGYTLGFIGCGTMGTAVLSAAIEGAAKHAADKNSDALVPKRFVVNVRTAESRERLRQKFGNRITIVATNQAVLDESNVVILAIKPNVARDILGPLAYSHFTVLVSLMAGTTIEALRQYTSINTFIVRATTNTAARIGQGMTALTFQGEYHPDSPITLGIEWLFSQTGELQVVEESKQDACVALCGSAPAFTYLFMEALIDGAVKMGLPAETARVMAAQVVKGAGSLALESGEQPAALRTAVCTPAGTTINGLVELEDRNTRSAVIHAIEASTRVAQELSRPPEIVTHSVDPSRTQSSINLAEMAQNLTISRKNTLNTVSLSGQTSTRQTSI